MAQDEGKKEEKKFEFTPEVEALGYISLDQARLIAMQTARDSPGDYGTGLSQTRMAFEVTEDHDTEDHYIVTLSYRPQGQFTGAPGQEQFFIEKEGTIAHRQVLSVPLPEQARWWRSRVALVAVGIMVVVAVAVGGVIATIIWGEPRDAAPLAAASPKSTPVPSTLSPSPAPTTGPLAVAATGGTASPTLVPIPTVSPLAAPAVISTATPTLAPTPTTTVSVIFPTPTPLPVATLTPTQTPRPTRTPAPGPEPQQNRLVHWWPGDGHFDDVVGSDDGTLTGNVTFAPGIARQAFSFDGSGSVTLGNLGDTTSAGTIALWINPSVVEDVRHPFTTDSSSGDNAVRFEESGSRTFYAVIGNATGSIAWPDYAYLKDGLLPNSWHHVVLIWENYGRDIKGYFDVVERFTSATNPYFPTSFPDARIGVGGGIAPVDFWKGLVDDVTIYNYALGAEEVEAIYNGGDLVHLLSLQLGEVENREVSLGAGESLQIVADIRDSDGNRVGSPLIAWQVASEVGSMAEFGILTAGTKAGTFSSAIEVNVVHEGERASGIVDVTVLPGPLSKIEIQPSEVVIQPGETATMTAEATDAFGNPVPAGLFLWEADSGLTVDQTGTVTAGEKGGRYLVSVRARGTGGQVYASATVRIPPVWLPTGDMRARGIWQNAAALLPSTKVLLVGRYNGTAEIYEPDTQRFRITGVPNCNGGGGIKATLLADDRVLITGGISDRQCAEIYDPQTEVFSRVDDLNFGHGLHTATLLSDGRVLIVGGAKDASVEIFDPKIEKFSPTGNLNSSRRNHSASLLPSGRVLIVGGESANGQCLRSAEVYDPTDGTFRLISGLGFNNCEIKATTLQNNDILITSQRGSAALFEPAKESFRATGSMITGRGRHTATRLSTGQVLVTGGYIGGTPWPPPALASAEIYDPVTERFTATASMNQERQGHTATLLDDGQVLIAGGAIAAPEGSKDANDTGEVGLDSAELWIPANE